MYLHYIWLCLPCIERKPLPVLASSSPPFHGDPKDSQCKNGCGAIMYRAYMYIGCGIILIHFCGVLKQHPSVISVSQGFPVPFHHPPCASSSLHAMSLHIGLQGSFPNPEHSGIRLPCLEWQRTPLPNIVMCAGLALEKSGSCSFLNTVI